MPIRLRDLPPRLAQRLGLTAPPRQKFNAVTVIDQGERFDSLKERARYGELVTMQKAGLIENLQRQPQYLITRNGQVIATFRADFRYRDRQRGVWVIEDVKGGRATRTEAYVLRRNLVEAQYGITVQEI